MKKHLISLATLLLVPCVSFAGSWTVHLPGSSDPYDCGECVLATPYPDSGTLGVINNWLTDTGVFTLPPGDTAPPPAVNIGDTVALCNDSSCSTYTKGSDGIFNNGSNKPITGNSCPKN